MAKSKEAQKSEVSGQNGVAEVTLCLPLGDLPETGYEAQQVAGGRMHLNHILRAKAASGLMRLRNGLRAQHAELSEGRPVHTLADALRYLLETLDDASK